MDIGKEFRATGLEGPCDACGRFPNWGEAAFDLVSRDGGYTGHILCAQCAEKRSRIGEPTF